MTVTNSAWFEDRDDAALHFDRTLRQQGVLFVAVHRSTGSGARGRSCADSRGPWDRAARHRAGTSVVRPRRVARWRWPSPPAHSRVRVTTKFVLALEGLERDLDRLGLLVERDGDVAGDEVRLVLRFEGEVVREMGRSTQFGDHLGQPLGEGGELLLLALHDHESSTLAGLEEEESIAHLAAHADHHLVGIGEDVVHEGARSFSDSVLLTLNTTGVEFVKPIALIEQVEMTVRWKRSSGTPWA